MKIVTFLLTLTLTFTAQAQNGNSTSWDDNFVPYWDAQCKYQGNDFTFSFKSRSGDATEDDIQTSLTWNATPRVQLSIPVALYLRTVPINSNIVSLCNRLQLFDIGENRLLLLLQKDDRPSEPHVVAVLIDGRSGKILDINGDIGVEGLEPVIRSVPNGLQIKLVERWNDTNKLAESVAVEGWRKVTVVGGKLKVIWEK